MAAAGSLVSTASERPASRRPGSCRPAGTARWRCHRPRPPAVVMGGVSPDSASAISARATASSWAVGGSDTRQRSVSAPEPISTDVHQSTVRAAARSRSPTTRPRRRRRRAGRRLPRRASSPRRGTPAAPPPRRRGPRPPARCLGDRRHQGSPLARGGSPRWRPPGSAPRRARGPARADRRQRPPPRGSSASPIAPDGGQSPADARERPLLVDLGQLPPAQSATSSRVVLEPMSMQAARTRSLEPTSASPVKRATCRGPAAAVAAPPPRRARLGSKRTLAAAGTRAARRPRTAGSRRRRRQR